MERLCELVVELSGGKEGLRESCRRMLDLVTEDLTPPEVATGLLRFIRSRTGLLDPFWEIKRKEFKDAEGWLRRFPQCACDPISLLKLSAIGNSSDYFLKGFEVLGDEFLLPDVDKIEKQIYNKKKGVLIVGDNVADFLFDMPLVEFLRGQGRKVYYLVKKGPIQNDLSMQDVRRFGLLDKASVTFVSGTDYVGIMGRDLEGILVRLGEIDTVIAKGMANYETLSEWAYKVPVIHVMKAKCKPVSEAIGAREGSYVIRVFGA